MISSTHFVLHLCRRHRAMFSLSMEVQRQHTFPLHKVNDDSHSQLLILDTTAFTECSISSKYDCKHISQSKLQFLSNRSEIMVFQEFVFLSKHMLVKAGKFKGVHVLMFQCPPIQNAMGIRQDTQYPHSHTFRLYR